MRDRRLGVNPLKVGGEGASGLMPANGGLRCLEKNPQADELQEGKGRFWQPQEKRNFISTEGRKWQEEYAGAVAGRKVGREDGRLLAGRAQ